MSGVFGSLKRVEPLRTNSWVCLNSSEYIFILGDENMPRLDGTGPRGEGPMTGWGMGYCVVSAAPERRIGMWRGGGGYGRGYGRGRGFGRGYGRGRGFGPGLGYGYRQGPAYYPPAVGAPIVGGQIAPEDEVKYLEEELQAIESEKKDITSIENEIKSRLKELKK